MRNKKFLALALTGLVVLGGLVYKNESECVHSSETCTITDILHGLGLKDLAYNHLANAINRSEGYEAEYVTKNRYIFDGVIAQRPGIPDGLFRSKDDLLVDYTEFQDKARLAVVYTDRYVDLKVYGKSVKELRIR